jgi:hypothetical protein
MGLGALRVEVRQDEIIVTEPGPSRAISYACKRNPTESQSTCEEIYRVQDPSVVAGERQGARARLDRIARLPRAALFLRLRNVVGHHREEAY